MPIHTRAISDPISTEAWATARHRIERRGTRHHPALLAWALTLMAGCAGTSSTPTGPNPEVEQEFLRDRATAQESAARRTYERHLLDIDKALDKYVPAKIGVGTSSADSLVESLDMYLNETVAKNFDRLMVTATDSTYPHNRAIAVGALGFSKRSDALNPLLNGLNDPDETIVTNAAFGLGILKDARTPPESLGAVIENARLSSFPRIGASWALLHLQSVYFDPSSTTAIWLRVLSSPINETDPAILVHSLRGIGLQRKPELAKNVEGFVAHPTPLVRAACAVAIGRLGNAASHESLLALIGPAETNQNVRLAARKALEALAGGISRGYDVDEWRKVFQRGH